MYNVQCTLYIVLDFSLNSKKGDLPSFITLSIGNTKSKSALLTTSDGEGPSPGDF